MGGSSMDDDWAQLASPCNGVRTLVLVGRTGNGKSATGNTILRSKAFNSRASFSGVTSSCELQQTVLPDGQILNVIDTPGLFDVTAEHDLVCKEIVKCIDLAKDGIHAILMVFSVKTRFSEEEESALRGLIILFGSKIVSYMIVVFTGGVELEDDVTLKDYLDRECPPPLKDVLMLCGNRRVLFNNKTKDERKRTAQVQELLSLVNAVVAHNDGKPYTDELFRELKEEADRLQNEQKMVGSLKGHPKGELEGFTQLMHESHAEQLKRITYMVEAKLKVTTVVLEQKLSEEQAARKKSDNEIRMLRESLEKAQKETGVLRKAKLAEEQAARKKSDNEIRMLRKNFEKAQKETDVLRKAVAEPRCAIL